MKNVLKKAFLVLALCPLAAHAAGRNSLSLELLGRGGLMSVNFDRFLLPRLAVGVGYSSVSASATSTSGGVTTTTSASLKLIPIYANLYLNRGMLKLYATGGYDIGKTDSTSSTKGAQIGGVPNAGLGVELRGWLLFRAAYYVFFVSGTAIKWPGASIGLSF